jgi:hypothetical protein
MFPWWRRGWNRGAEVAETTVKRLLCCRFPCTGKGMWHVYQCWWRTCREINVFFFQVRTSHVLRFISICDLFTGSPSYYVRCQLMMPLAVLCIAPTSCAQPSWFASCFTDVSFSRKSWDIIKKKNLAKMYIHPHCFS